MQIHESWGYVHTRAIDDGICVTVVHSADLDHLTISDG
jgi:hypothetical protein